MKTISLIIIVFFSSQICYSQFTVAQNVNKKCPLPKYKKGQTSAQVNEETRIYVECVKEFKERQATARRENALEAEKRKAEKIEQKRLERERYQQARQLERENRQQEIRRRQQEIREQREREQLKRDLYRENLPEVQG